MDEFEDLNNPKIPNWKIVVMGVALTVVGVLFWTLI